MTTLPQTSLASPYGLDPSHLGPEATKTLTFKECATIMYSTLGNGYPGHTPGLVQAMSSLLLAHLGGTPSSVAQALCLDSVQASSVASGLSWNPGPTPSSLRILTLALYALAIPGYRTRAAPGMANWLVPSSPPFAWNSDSAQTPLQEETTTRQTFQKFAGAETGHVTPYDMARAAAHIYGKGPRAAGLWHPVRALTDTDLVPGEDAGTAPNLIPGAHPTARILGPAVGPLDVPVFYDIYKSLSAGWSSENNDAELNRLLAALYATDPSAAYSQEGPAGSVGVGRDVLTMLSTEPNMGAAIERMYAFRLLGIPTARQALAAALGFELAGQA